MQEEIQLHYSPSKWVVRDLSGQVVQRHIEVATEASHVAQAKVPHKLNVQYGPNPSQLLDFYGTDLAKESPIFIYIHGGYWQALSKDISAYPVIPLWEAGIRTAIVGYNLASQVTLNTIVQDIREMAIFLLKMASEENCIGVWFGGHSAGGHLCACLFDGNWFNCLKAPWREKLRGVFLISGIFDITPLLHTTENETLKLTLKNALELSPMFHLGELTMLKKIKVLLCVAEHDPPAFHGQAMAYSKVLKKRKIETLIIEIPDLDHFSIVESLQYPFYELTQRIISMINLP